MAIAVDLTRHLSDAHAGSGTRVDRDSNIRDVAARDLTGLALSLLDIRAAHEANLRSLTAITRMLEAVRGGTPTSGVTDLLLGEMGRHLDDLVARADALCDAVTTVRDHLTLLRPGSAVPPA